MGVWDVATRHSTATWIWYALTSLGKSWSWMPPTGAMSLHSLHMVSLVVSSWTHIEESCLAISWWQHAFQTREFEVCLQVTWKHFLTIFFLLKKHKQTNKQTKTVVIVFHCEVKMITLLAPKKIQAWDSFGRLTYYILCSQCSSSDYLWYKVICSCEGLVLRTCNWHRLSCVVGSILCTLGTIDWIDRC